MAREADSNSRVTPIDRFIIKSSSYLGMAGLAYYLYNNPISNSFFVNVAAGVGIYTGACIAGVAAYTGVRYALPDYLKKLKGQRAEKQKEEQLEKENKALKLDKSKISLIVEKDKLYSHLNKMEEHKVEFFRETKPMNYKLDGEEFDKESELHSNGMWKLGVRSDDKVKPFNCFDKDGKYEVFVDKNQEFEVEMAVGLGNCRIHLDEWQKTITFKVKPDDEKSMEYFKQAVKLFESNDKDGYLNLMKDMKEEYHQNRANGIKDDRIEYCFVVDDDKKIEFKDIEPYINFEYKREERKNNNYISNYKFSIIDYQNDDADYLAPMVEEKFINYLFEADRRDEKIEEMVTKCVENGGKPVKELYKDFINSVENYNEMTTGEKKNIKENFKNVIHDMEKNKKVRFDASGEKLIPMQREIKMENLGSRKQQLEI